MSFNSCGSVSIFYMRVLIKELNVGGETSTMSEQHFEQRLGVFEYISRMVNELRDKLSY